MFRAIAFFRLRRSTKRQKTLFRTFVSRRNGKKLFFGPSSVDKTAKNSFLRLRWSTKRQKTFFQAFVGRRNGPERAATGNFYRTTKKKAWLRTGKDPDIVGQAFLFMISRRHDGKRQLPNIHPILRCHKHRIALLDIKCLIEGLDITQSRVYTPFAQ